MADYGLLQGLAEGVKAGLGTYQQFRQLSLDEQKAKEAEDLKKEHAVFDQALKKKEAIQKSIETKAKLGEVTGEIPAFSEDELGYLKGSAPMQEAANVSAEQPSGLMGGPGLIKQDQPVQGGLLSGQPIKVKTKQEREEDRALRNANLTAVATRGEKIIKDPVTGDLRMEQVSGGTGARRADLGIQEQELDIKKKKKALDEEKSGKTIPATEAAGFGGSDASLQALDNVASAFTSNKDLTGPIQGKLSGLLAAGEIGESGKRAKSFDAQLKINAQNIGKYLEGGKLTDADIDRYKQMLPNLGDSEDVAKQKVELVKGLIQSKKNNELAGLKSAGYNTRGFEGQAQPPTLQTKIVNGVTYQKVQGGWQEVK